MLHSKASQSFIRLTYNINSLEHGVHCTPFCIGCFGYLNSYIKLLKESFIKITNFSNTRAGIIQKQEAALRVKQEKEADWLFKIVMQGHEDKVTAYLRIYSIGTNGEVAMPWEYSFKVGIAPELFKQVIHLDQATRALRLETGILGPGRLSIIKLIAYPYVRFHLKQRPTNHIQTIGEIIKPIQLAMPIPLKIPVNVQAKVTADIRNLTPVRDKVQICGSNQVPLALSMTGRVQADICGHEFYESFEDVQANEIKASSITRDVSGLFRFSFAVCNFGTSPAFLQTELSPDGFQWTAKGTQREVKPKELVIISPKGFLRYTRVSYWAENMTALRIWIQAQA